MSKKKVMENHSLDHNFGIKEMILHYNLATRNIIINLSKRERNLQSSNNVFPPQMKKKFNPIIPDH